MIKANYHTHTQFCDGKSTAEEMVTAAINAGLETLGFSGHSHTPFDESYCMTKEKTAEYKAEIARLKEKYADKINILCGIEQDFYADTTTEGYEYSIGSVHYLEFDGEYVPVDEGTEKHVRAAQKYLNGDIYAFAEKYYETVALVAEKTGCDIIGHFDLIVKYNERDNVYDENNPRYIAAWQKAADRLLKSGKPFEINTGAIARGARSIPYPSKDIIAYIKEHGGRLILSSDCHAADKITCAFDECEKLL